MERADRIAAESERKGGAGRRSARAWTFFRRVLASRCPQCGRGSLFRRFARLRDDCGECGLVYRREQGAQTGAMYLTAAVNQVVAAILIFAIVLLTDWGVTLSIAVSLPIVLVFCVVFLPHSMGLWVAIEYWTDVRNGEAWAEPRD